MYCFYNKENKGFFKNIRHFIPFLIFFLTVCPTKIILKQCICAAEMCHSHRGNQRNTDGITMLEWTVACSMYLAIPVTNAFLSSKLVLKFG